MSYFLSPVLNEMQFDANGDPLAGGFIYTYLAGTTTPVTTYKTSTGTAHTNPIVLDSAGYYPTGTQLWLEGGKTYKFVVQDSLGATLRTIDNITGANDTNLAPDEWVQYTSTAFTYLSATSFSVAGDQTNIFQVGRRVKTMNTGGLAYSTILTSIYGAPNTTVTLSNDSTPLDSGLSAVSYGILAADNPSYPNFLDNIFRVVDNGDKTKKVAFEASGITTATTRTVTFPDKSGTMAMLDDISIPRNYIAGCTLSTAGSSATMSIAAGQATDSTNAVVMSFSAINKTTSAWAVGSGNGGLDTGVIANGTWYYFYVIRRPDTGVVDIVFSTNSSTPTLPANYTQYRYIGAAITNGSAQWVLFIQDGDDFMWATPILDFTGAGSAAAALLTCTVPRKRVKAHFNLAGFGSGGNSYAIYLSDPSAADLAPSQTVAPLASAGVQAAGVNAISQNPASCYTNTSAQVRHREINTQNVYITTLGWTDSRGKNT